jgi:excisionase family DNA binding protein
MIRAAVGEEIRTAVRDVLAETPPESVTAERLTTPREYLTIKDTATRAAVHEITVRRWIKDGRLKAAQIGRVLRIDAKDLADCMSPSPAAASEATIEQRAREILTSRH